MPTEIYKINKITTIDGIEIEVSPLKIKYLKELMDVFSKINDSNDDEESFSVLAECAFVAMKQYLPGHFKTIEEVEDSLDLETLYDLLDYAANLKLRKGQEEIEINDTEQKGTTWESLDLAKLETEVFLLGIWKNFDELESSISIEELMQILSITRELDYEEKKFLAAIQGINLDESSGKDSGEVKGQQEWENLKAKVASGGRATDAKDILALQGIAAKQAGFGIGMGLGYEDLRDPTVIKNN